MSMQEGEVEPHNAQVLDNCSEKTRTANGLTWGRGRVYAGSKSGFPKDGILISNSLISPVQPSCFVENEDQYKIHLTGSSQGHKV